MLAARLHQRFFNQHHFEGDLVAGALPSRMVAHKREITRCGAAIASKVNWRAGRQASVPSELYGGQISRLFRIPMRDNRGQQACFRNGLEFLVMAAYSRADTGLLMMMPEPDLCLRADRR